MVRIMCKCKRGGIGGDWKMQGKGIYLVIWDPGNWEGSGKRIITNKGI